LKRFGLGLAGMALACFGLADKAEADNGCQTCTKQCRDAGGSQKFCPDQCSFLCHPIGGV
jgi:hypothetical protein